MRRIGLALVEGMLVAACGAAPPSLAPGPSGTPVPVQPPGNPQVLACLDISSLECDGVASGVLAVLPPQRGTPFTIQVRLAPCPDAASPCPKSLAARTGTATVEYEDAGEPLVFHLAGPPPAGAVEPIAVGPWTDPIQPGSPQADGPGPYDFEIGHCGILHVVDFDGSFWVLVGAVDGGEPALLSSDTGTIRLVSHDRAEYASSGGATFELARFPGARRFQLCD